jgi:hypothetical protein
MHHCSVGHWIPAYFLTCIASLNNDGTEGHDGIAGKSAALPMSRHTMAAPTSTSTVGLNPSQGSHPECELDLDSSIGDPAAVGPPSVGFGAADAVPRRTSRLCAPLSVQGWQQY